MSKEPTSTAGRTQWYVLALVFLVALVMRGADFWGQMHDNPFFGAPMMDERMHHMWAEQIASGEGMGPKPFFRAPLYYCLLAGLYALAGPNIALARALGYLMGALTCVLVTRLGTILVRPAVGLIAGLLAALYWPQIYFDGQLLTVGLEVFLGTALLLVLIEAVRRGSLGLCGLAGIVWGLAAITRPNFLVAAPVIAIWLWVGAPLARRRMHKLAALGLIGLGAVVTILPVTLYNRIVGGEWVLIATNGGVNFYIGNNPWADGEAAVVPGTRRDWVGGFEDTHTIPEHELGRKLTEGEVSDYWMRKGLAWIREDPGRWAALTLHKLRLFWSPVEIPNNQPAWFFARLSLASGLYWIGFPVVACLGLAGLVVIGRSARMWFVPLAFAGVYMASVVAFFCADRYRLPIVPVLMLPAAAGLGRLPELWRQRRFARLGGYGAVLAAAALFLYTNPPPRDAFNEATEGSAHYDLGLHYIRLAPQQPEYLPLAVAHFEEAVRLRPYHGIARLWLGLGLLDLEREDEAEEQFAAALEMGHDDPGIYTFYGHILRSRGRLAEAAEQYRAAIQEQPAMVDAYMDLGEVLVELGDKDEAAKCYQHVLSLDAGHEEAARRLAELELGEQTPTSAP
ncbi:MAG: tetratricopeptide repeat protein [Phycisphaerae bacterium]|jgi:Tfp pilus assembly protein PilF